MDIALSRVQRPITQSGKQAGYTWKRSNPASKPNGGQTVGHDKQQCDCAACRSQRKAAGPLEPPDGSEIDDDGDESDPWELNPLTAEKIEKPAEPKRKPRKGKHGSLDSSRDG